MVSVDPVGASLGATTLSVEAVSLCISAFDVWQTAENAGEDVKELKFRIRCAAARLKIWKLEWGLDRNEHLQNPRMLEFGDIAADYVTMIHLIGSRLEDLDSRYMTAVTTVTTGTNLIQRLSALAGIDSLQRQALQNDIQEIRSTTGIVERFQWALRNKKKVLDALTRTEYLIDGLYKILPPPAHDPAAQIAINKAFLTENVQDIETIKELPGLDPTVAAMSAFKLAIVKLKTRTTTAADEPKSWKSREIREIISEDKQNSRDVRKLVTKGDKFDVLIEWKPIQSDGTPLELKRRVKDVACLLRAEQKPEKLQTLPCIGTVDDKDNLSKEDKMGLIYKIPSREFFSLRTILSQSQHPMFLGQRFGCAYMLVHTVWYLHLAGWLHKGIRSDNVLFFAETTHDWDVSNTYLVGFDHSREDQKGAATEDALFNAEVDFNLYRHPDCQGVPYEPQNDDPNQGTQLRRIRPSFSREFDIYSVGVILLELGFNATIGSLHRKHLQKLGKDSLGVEAIKAWMIDELGAGLGVRIGKMYQDATLLCLTGNLEVDTNRSLGEAFYADVVRPLAQCKA